jgi:hypothetical protein
MAEVLTIAGFLGWAATLTALSFALLPMARALAIQQRINREFDDRVIAVVSRSRAIKPQPAGPPPPQAPPASSVEEALARAFASQQAEPVYEQPSADEGLEVIDQ